MRAAVRTHSWATPDVFFGLLLLLGVLLTYQPALHAGYIWDDDELLTGNRCVVGPLGLKEIWTTKAADICPLTITTFWAEYKLWRLAPGPYHLVTVLLHAASAILLWRVLLSLRVPGAWLGAALWALHPVQVESVAWISEMKNTQSGMFFLLAVFFFLRLRRARELHSGGEPWSRAATVLCAALAMASKSSALVLPVVLCLLAWWQQSRWRWQTLWDTGPVFLLSLVAGLGSLWTQRFDQVVGTGTAVVRGWPERFAVAGDAVWFYLGKLLWPHPLMTVYPRWQVNVRDWTTFLPLVAVLVVALVLWRQRRARGGWWLAGAYFLAVLFPMLGLVEISYFRHSFVADHFLYLASMGPLALAGAGLARLLPESLSGTRWWQSAVGAALLLVTGAASWQRTRVYESQRTLWTDELTKNPQAWIAHSNMGEVFRKEGRLDDAIAEFGEALKLNPGVSENYDNLGNVRLEKGNVDAAIGLYQAALKLNPTNALVPRNLALAFLRKGQVDAAINEYRDALKVDPGNANTHYDLGNIYLERDSIDEAIIEYRAALQIDSQYAPVHRNLGFALMQKGAVNDAIVQFTDALKIDPNYASTHANLGFALLRVGRLDDAIIQYREVLETTPDDSLAHHSLGMILARKGRLEEAIEQLQEAIHLKPDYIDAKRDLAAMQLAARRAAGVP